MEETTGIVEKVVLGLVVEVVRAVPEAIEGETTTTISTTKSPQRDHCLLRLIRAMGAILVIPPTILEIAGTLLHMMLPRSTVDETIEEPHLLVDETGEIATETEEALVVTWERK